MLRYTVYGGKEAFIYGGFTRFKEEGQTMPIRYRIDVLSALKEKGYSTYKLRKEKLLGESVLQQIRDNELISWSNVSRLCALLQCQPGDIVEYVEEGGTDEV